MGTFLYYKNTIFIMQRIVFNLMAKRNYIDVMASHTTTNAEKPVVSSRRSGAARHTNPSISIFEYGPRLKNPRKNHVMQVPLVMFHCKYLSKYIVGADTQ